MSLFIMQGMTSFSANARTIQHPITIFGSTIQSSIEIENSYKSSIDFNLRGRTYTFVITQWKGKGLGKFIELFHEHSLRDMTQFGRVLVKDTAEKVFVKDMDDVSLLPLSEDLYVVGPNYHTMTNIQKLNIIEQACKDIARCLAMIANVHQRSILEYCVWYRENHDLSTYRSFVTKITSHCVVHNDFMAPDQTWTLVEFND